MTPEQLAEAADAAAMYVEVTTGMRNQFIAQGWNEGAAEQMVAIAMMSATNGQKA